MTRACYFHARFDGKCKICIDDWLEIEEKLREVFPDYDKQLEAAMRRGTTQCPKCKFVLYKGPVEEQGCPKCLITWKEKST